MFRKLFYVIPKLNLQDNDSLTQTRLTTGTSFSKDSKSRTQFERAQDEDSGKNRAASFITKASKQIQPK